MELVMKIVNFDDLYLAELSEASSFEHILSEGLSDLASKVSADRLRQAISGNGVRGAPQESELDRLMKKHGHKPGEHVDHSMQEMLGEARKMADMVDEGPLRDAAIIASIQRMKHYEIAVYGTLANYAHRLGLEDDEKTLETMLKHEKEIDRNLSEIATKVVNPQAMH
jgi:ferritin-like metal-binding protein YciE